MAGIDRHQIEVEGRPVVVQDPRAQDQLSRPVRELGELDPRCAGRRSQLPGRPGDPALGRGHGQQVETALRGWGPWHLPRSAGEEGVPHPGLRLSVPSDPVQEGAAVRARHPGEDGLEVGALPIEAEEVAADLGAVRRLGLREPLDKAGALPGTEGVGGLAARLPLMPDQRLAIHPAHPGVEQGPPGDPGEPVLGGEGGGVPLGPKTVGVVAAELAQGGLLREQDPGVLTLVAAEQMGEVGLEAAEVEGAQRRAPRQPPAALAPQAARLGVPVGHVVAGVPLHVEGEVACGQVHPALVGEEHVLGVHDGVPAQPLLPPAQEVRGLPGHPDHPQVEDAAGHQLALGRAPPIPRHRRHRMGCEDYPVGAGEAGELVQWSQDVDVGVQVQGGARAPGQHPAQKPGLEGGRQLHEVIAGRHLEEPGLGQLQIERPDLLQRRVRGGVQRAVDDQDREAQPPGVPGKGLRQHPGEGQVVAGDDGADLELRRRRGGAGRRT